jgi:hypothetical protein
MVLYLLNEKYSLNGWYVGVCRKVLKNYDITRNYGSFA